MLNFHHQRFFYKLPCILLLPKNVVKTFHKIQNYVKIKGTWLEFYALKNYNPNFVPSLINALIHFQRVSFWSPSQNFRFLRDNESMCLCDISLFLNQIWDLFWLVCNKFCKIERVKEFMSILSCFVLLFCNWERSFFKKEILKNGIFVSLMAT